MHFAVAVARAKFNPQTGGPIFTVHLSKLDFFFLSKGTGGQVAYDGECGGATVQRIALALRNEMKRV